MKKSIIKLLCLLLLITCVFGIASCADTGGNKPGGGTENPGGTTNPGGSTTPPETDTVYIVKDGKTDYTIVYSNDTVDHSTESKDLYSTLALEYLGEDVDIKRVEYTSSSYQEKTLEILIGATDRAVSQELVTAVNAKSNGGKDMAWGYCYKNGKLAYYANCDEALEYSWDIFIELICKESTVEVKKDLYVVDMKDKDDYIFETTYTEGAKYYTQNNFDIDNGQITAAVSHSDKYSTVTLNGNGYSIARIVSNLGTVKANNFYDIRVDVIKNNSKTDVDILEIWYDESGRELQMQYVDPDKLSLSPESAARLDVYALIRGEGADTVKLSVPKLRYVKPYEKREVKLAAVAAQTGNVNGRPRTMQDNLDYILAEIDTLCASTATKPDLILFTEDVNNCGVSFADPHDAFIRMDSDFVKAIQAKAKQYKVYISFSINEVDDNGYYYNSAPLIDRNGEIIAVHRKCHLTMKELAKGIIPGNEVTVCETDFGKVGIAICWDLFFNNYVDILGEMDVDLIINPSYGYWDDINSMRAEDSGAYIITAGQSASGTAIVCPEGCINPSQVVDYGNIIEKGSDPGNNGTVLATVDLNQRFRVKYLSANSSSIRHNVYDNEDRPDLYN